MWHGSGVSSSPMHAHTHAIWARAQEVGFDQIRVAAYHIPPYHVTLEQYDDLLAGGETYLRWAELTRAFLGNVRNFFLERAGEEALDSRRTEGLAAAIEVTLDAERAAAGAPIPARARVTNAGRSLWLPSGTIPGGVSLGSHLSAASGEMLRYDYHWQDLTTPARTIAPGAPEARATYRNRSMGCTARTLPRPAEDLPRPGGPGYSPLRHGDRRLQ